MSMLLGRIPPQLVGSGIFPDMHQQSAPLWATGRNAFFREGKVGPFPGYTALATVLPGSPVITGMKEVDTRPFTVNGVILGQATKLFKWTITGGMTQLTATGLSKNTDQSSSVIASRWSFEQWGSWILATNGVSPVKIYKGSSFASLSGTNFTTAEVLLRWRTFMFVFNLSTGKNDLKWCSDDNVELWTPAASNSAGGTTVRDVGGLISAATWLGNNVVFFGNDSMHAVNFVQAPNYFGVQRLLRGLGAWGKLSVAALGDGRLVGCGPRGVWTTDGTRIDYIDPPAVRSYIQRNLNQDQSSKVVVSYDLHSRCVFVYFPINSSGSNEPTGGVCFNTESKQWTRVDFARSAVTDGAIFNYTISGTTGGSLRKSNPTGTFEPITLETKFTDLGEFAEEGEALLAGDKLIDLVKLEIGDATLTNLNLYIGTKAHWGDSATWTGPYSVVSLDAAIKTRPPEARLVALRLIDATPLEMWQLTGIQLYGEVLGGRQG